MNRKRRRKRRGKNRKDTVISEFLLHLDLKKSFFITVT